MDRLTIIGGGFMGGAIAEGLVDSGWPREDITVAEVREARREFLTRQLRVNVTEDSATACAEANVVLLAVKPQNITETLEQIKTHVTEGALVLSVCAGVKISTIENILGEIAVIRTMPNTPAAIGLGATAITRGKFATDQHLADAINIFSTVGKVIVVDESQMDAVTAVSGTGPAYVFYLAETMIDAAMAEGLSKQHAYTLVYQTLRGAATLLAHDRAGPAELRERVTSPNGTTHAAIRHLQNSKWACVLKGAVKAAKDRSVELGG
ncbi:MAG: pyrroline-5-carboxylate reductase [Planctomycetes bacterium]|nr:pyrroline-5-carboxylate reductase [Planctomycetota bacterium]